MVYFISKLCEHCEYSVGKDGYIHVIFSMYIQTMVQHFQSINYNNHMTFHSMLKSEKEKRINYLKMMFRNETISFYT